MPSSTITRSFGLSTPLVHGWKWASHLDHVAVDLDHRRLLDRGVLSTSSEEPPSPPPTISTFFGARCA